MLTQSMFPHSSEYPFRRTQESHCSWSLLGLLKRGEVSNDDASEVRDGMGRDPSIHSAHLPDGTKPPISRLLLLDLPIILLAHDIIHLLPPFF